jgi:hypothetical protein
MGQSYKAEISVLTNETTRIRYRWLNGMANWQVNTVRNRYAELTAKKWDEQRSTGGTGDEFEHR